MKYGYKDGLKGVEADYWQVHDTLYIKLYGSNHWTDYVLNFVAWPRKRVGPYKVHRFWYRLAKDLSSKLPVDWDNINIVKVMGHSLGGAVGSILPLLLPAVEFHMTSINAPKSGATSSNHVAYYDKGDVVRHYPLFYPKYDVRTQYSFSKHFIPAHDNFPECWLKFGVDNI